MEVKKVDTVKSGTIIKGKNPCDKCKKKFDKKAPFCKSCINYGGGLKWHEVK